VQAVQKSLVDQIPPNSAVSIKLNTLDYYIGTELDNYIAGVHKFYDLVRQEEQQSGAKMDDERTAKLFDKAMKSAGFKIDSKFRLSDPEKVCDNCGERSKKKLNGVCQM